MESSRTLKKIMAFLLIIAILPVMLCVEAFAAPAASKSNGSFIVELWDGSTYEQVASVSTDEFQKEFKVDIGSVTDPQIRILKAADGLAFLDSVFLDGCAVSGNKKLLNTDFDVQEITTEGIVLHFIGRFDGKLSLTGRIEPKVIIGEPFMFPFGNTYIDDPQRFEDFFTYELGCNPRSVKVDGKFEDLGTAFESRYMISSTGHPAGTAYIYVSNDAQYLYACADFTGDNTFDYGKDFFKVFAKVDGTVKEFKQTSNGLEYGAAAMQYTDKVAYEHMYYEMRIPLDQLGNTNKLQLAFSLYGTFAISSVVSDPARLSFAAGQTAHGILRIKNDVLQSGLLTNIDCNSPGLDVQFHIPPVQNISSDGYLDVPYTVQCATPGNYAIDVTMIDINDSPYYNPRLQIPVQVNASDFLADIIIHNGTLSPTFDPGKLNYTVALDEHTSTINVDAVRANPLNKVYMNGRLVKTGRLYTLNTGCKKVVTIKVVTPSKTSRTYTVTVTRAKSTDADLSSLKVSGYSISPTFDKGVTSYTLAISDNRKSVTIMTKADEKHAWISINGRVMKTRTITLNKDGPTTVTIIVLAQAGNMQKYTLTITRGR